MNQGKKLLTSRPAQKLIEEYVTVRHFTTKAKMEEIKKEGILKMSDIGRHGQALYVNPNNPREVKIWKILLNNWGKNFVLDYKNHARWGGYIEFQVRKSQLVYHSTYEQYEDTWIQRNFASIMEHVMLNGHETYHFTDELENYNQEMEEFEKLMNQ